ncbi:cubilin-like isoform X2 [Daphnia pulex]|uniref:cubilin-like isoform X2 n=1 Tax=Daphnia pulex TaxID=6669 RepID=UPI001EE09B20|nr:cubilin-like isoform X2 [Daphnia pulex]
MVYVLIDLSGALYDGRVRIRTQDGHLQFMVPDERDISLMTGRNGRILFNGEDISFAYQTVRNVSLELTSLRQRELASLQNKQLELIARLDADTGESLNDRILLLEQSLANITSQVVQNSESVGAGGEGGGGGGGRGGGRGGNGSPVNLRRLRRRVQTIERNLQRLTTALQADDCASAPCKNGAICIDSYNNFQCLCSPNWEGPTCDIDVDECSGFRGTELGCQNGATCVNTAGSYRCTCPTGWFGVHCTQKTDGCNSGTNEQICGHGICLSQPGQGRGYICLCEQGWTTDGSNPGCTVDVDECVYPIPLCSVNPRVQCINLPGSFRCGPCPAGYSGNGHYCTDVDECQINNGGCSISPRVQCTNTIGSRSCGPCPPGYQGDGVFCSFVGVCTVNNGGCHPAAFCYDNPAISSSYVSCQCRPGFTGNGFGQMGCVPLADGRRRGGGDIGPVNYDNPCSPNPCVFGTCSVVGNGFQCTCHTGYAGQTCNIPLDACVSSPCRNGATCAVVGPDRQFRCICPAGFTGNECQNEIQACGGMISEANGTITFPSSDGGLYPHQVSCAWVINTTPGKVMNMTFNRFHLESSENCKFDWLQFHDGEDASAQIVGRYCGDQTFPGGSMVTTHNQIYLWFRSDHSVNGQGFELVWNTIDPVCGGVISTSTYGTINSPGYPGHYPANRDCIWSLSAPLGKRIQITFATLQLEHHLNCSYDFLEVHDGSALTDNSLGKFCSTANPPPLTTSGPYALLNFHSDATSTDNGFHITYAVVNGIPGCGGLLTGPGGTLSSPNHPDTYEHNLDCEWVIRATRNERVRLTFTALSIEASRNCRFDYVEVREGGTPQSPLIGRYCNRNLPLPVLSQGNQLFVRFRSDFSVASSGFRARFETVCGGTWTESSGRIQSPNFPSPYPASKQCVYIIALDPGKAVKLDFLTFDVEGSANCRYDYVEIRDGDTSNSTLIGRYCGPPSLIPPPIVSSHNYLWIKFQTDASDQNLGFQANFSAIDVGCGGILTSPRGVIASPLHPEVYPHGATCRWIVRAGPGKVVRLQWLSFALEPAPPACHFDSVSVYDNSTIPNTGGLVGRYCGNTLPPSITSTGDTITIVFKSDASLAAEGFTLTYITLNSSSLCGGTYYTETGMIASPGFPTGYQPSLDCTWIIRAPLNRQIQLNITDFDMENHTQCQMDYLEIRNGGGPTSPLIGNFCGRNIPRTIPSHSHEMFIRLVTDYSLFGRGFRLFWDASSTGCGGVLTSPEGSIVSPGYPSSYGENAECIWRIEVSHGSRVLFAFVDLDMESQPSGCAFDYVEVRNGRDRRAPLVGRYCNSFSLVPIVSKSTSLYVKFKSDMNLAGRGFKARYETLCNTELKGLSGVIESPNFPNNYPHNRNCTWTIAAPLGNRINLTFSHFDVEQHGSQDSSALAPVNCMYDFVEVRQPNGTLGRFCGSSLPPELGSTQDKVMIQFMSDLSVAHNGFRLEWRVIGCGGRLAKPFGIFKSPGYPVSYPFKTDCVWEIETEPGSRVELTIKDIDIESAVGCNYDFLRVHGGVDETSPKLAEFCHRQDKPVVVTAIGNHMYVHFHSDESLRGKGFSASFNTLPNGCGGYYKSPSGIIHSPNYPQNYDHDSDCTWLIEVPINHVVVLNFVDFDVEPFTNCTFDYVAVYDGPSLNDEEIARFCGSTIPNPSYVRSTSNKMFVRLKADGSVSARGFVANYTTGCGARITVNSEDTGELTSPNFPHYYSNWYNCTWTLTAANPDDRVYLMFTHMDLHSFVPQSSSVTATNTNCSMSFVRVQDGDDSDAPVIGNYCLTRVPSPITSQGSSLYVRLQTTPLMLLGVGFRATYSILTQSCGGEFTSEHGSFSSPAYPNSYPLSTECIWTISASAGNRVMVSFRMFNLQDTEFCNGDYLEIRTNDGGGELLGHFCGTGFLPSNITASNKLWIKFRSDDDSTAPGFIADYSLLHGNDLSGNRGEIASPLFPHPYIHRDDFSWRVTVDAERFVRLYFYPQFSIEREHESTACISSLLVYDGYDEQAPLLGEYCGETRPRQMYVTASGNVVYIVFRSRSFEGSFFRLRWDAVVTNSPAVLSTPAPMNSSVTCGGEYFVTDGNFTMVTSPGFPIGYANNLICRWVLTTDPHYRVAITLITLDMEAGSCMFDRVEINNGENERPQLLGRYCRRDQQGLVVTSAGNSAVIYFRTDATVNQTGFQINAKAVCGGIVRQSSGIIKSPKYPANYPASTTCEWDVSVRPGRKITVSFDNMQIASDMPACSQDYVILRNGDSVDSPVLGSGRLCGNSIPTSALVTTGNKLHIKFVSDGQTNSAGFQLRFEEVRTSCGGRLTLNNDISEVTIESPNRPSPSPPYAECEWIILAPGGHAVQLDFVGQLDIQSQYGCRSAGVEIRNGGTLSAPVLGRYCGRNPPGSIFSTGNSLHVRYFNSLQNPGTGFQARVSIARCGGTIVGSRGTLKSPNYPSSYEPNTRCVWTIRGPVGHYLNFVFTNLDLPSASAYGGNCSNVDYVQIRERNATNEILATICGNSYSDVISSYSNEVDVIFQTGGRVYNRQGFRMTYNTSVDGCGGDVSGPSGIIQSPGYPNSYPHGRICTWKIRGLIGRRITLTFTDFALEGPVRRTGAAQSECQDFVYAINGPDFQSPPLYRNSSRRCGSTLPEIVSSSGHNMILIFRTDGSVTHRGFSARYDTDQPAVCGGELNGAVGASGYFTSPGLISPTSGNYSDSLHCEWQLINNEQSNSSVIFKIEMMDMEGPMQNTEQCTFDSLNFYGASTRIPMGQYCGNQTSGTSIYNPFLESLIRFTTDSTITGLGFNTSYRVSPCGGDITNPQTISTPNFPAYYGLGVDCVWVIDLSENGQQVQVTFDDLQLDSEDCSQDYLRILNGYMPTSPQLGRYCGSTRPNVIRSQSSYLWIHFHSDNISGNSRGFSITVDAVASGCGGIMHSRTGVITSPNYPSAYGTDAECEWEIRVDPGYKVIADFFQRFDLENSTNCQNDFVELMDWKNETWHSLGRFCGKQFPPTISTSGESMKILFRSNSAHQGDGFRMRWKVGCGGEFDGPTGLITSPNYPMNYGDNLVCNYTITASADTYIIAQFIDKFQIESHPLCIYDRLAAYQGNSSSSAPLGRYCGSQNPSPIVSHKNLFMQFRTDGSMSGSGFKISYTKQECGGTITSPTIISSPSHPDTYYNNLNCTWRIEAPADQVIDIKFQSLTLETHRDCRYDWVAAYEGLQVNRSQLLGQYCGNFTYQLPRIKSRGSKALVHFRTDWSVSHGGFSASVRFTSGERQGCGGLVNLTANPQQQLRAPDAAVLPRNGHIDGELDCQWTVIAPPGKVIRLQLTQIDMTDAGCSEDYLEARDGASKSASLIGRYCGTVVPPSLIGSTNIMWVQLVTGTSNRRANFVASLSYQETPCGPNAGTLDATDANQILSSPNYPAAPGVNLRCRWLIDGNSTAVKIHFQHLSIGSADSAQCTNDRLEVQDVVNGGQNQEANDNLVLNGDGATVVRLDQHQGIILQRELDQRLTFCGSRLPHDVISSGGALAVTLITGTSAGSSGGFQLQYSLATCNRSYDGIEGRIVSPRWPGLFRSNDYCQMTIESPANTTISLYFNIFRLMNSLNCSVSSLEIRDGGTSSDPLLGNLCGSALPNSIFSTGNRLWIRFRPSLLPQRGYDLTYTSTNQGSGCGGSVFNTRGTVTSPGYPGNVSRTTDCRWELAVPIGMIIKIEFPVFQFGPADDCTNNYVEISDIQQNAGGAIGEAWRARYCGNDRPSTYLGTSNGVTLRYVTSTNNTGLGWRAVFQAVTSIHANQ